MDIQINDIHSPAIFSVVLSDLMGFWDASISSSDHTRRHFCIYLPRISFFFLLLQPYAQHCVPFLLITPLPSVRRQSGPNKMARFENTRALAREQ